MNVSRNFLVIGSIYILIGMILGSYMGGSGDHSLAPLHAHINLLGFVLPAAFALLYRSYPAMAASATATAHFWLHQIGTLVLVIFLYLLLGGTITEESGATLMAPIAELAIIVATGLFAWNIFQNAR
ncbi:MAG: hypothetical protein ACSHXD_13840 [Marinosulfonomonas sp.]